MKIEELQEKLSQKKKGTYFTIMYGKNTNGYAKTTTTTVRLAKYANVVKKEPSEIKHNDNDTMVGNNIIINQKSGKARLQVFLTNNPHHKPHSIYEYNGEEISREEYYEKSGRKPNNPKVMFCIMVEDIIMVK